jgi:hypothetical protein
MAASFTKTYDPKKVIITFGGTPISGFPDGTFLSIKGSAERFTRKVGADGEVVRSRSNDDTHEVTLTLSQTSPSNSYLSTILEIDRLTNKGIKPLSITDLGGSSLYFWPEAWISKDPDADFAKEAGERAWVLHTGQIGAQSILGDFVPASS